MAIAAGFDVAGFDPHRTLWVTSFAFLFAALERSFDIARAETTVAANFDWRSALDRQPSDWSA